MRWEVMIASVGQPSASLLDMTGLVMIRSLTLSLIWSILLGVGLPAVSWGQATEEPEKAELEWSDFDEAKFDKKRFTGPMIVAIMKDLCPGCKAKRDALWSNRKLVEAVVQQKMEIRRFGRNPDFTPYLAEAQRPVGGNLANNQPRETAAYDLRFKGRETNSR